MSSVIARGHDVIAEAEAHSKIIEEYANGKKAIDVPLDALSNAESEYDDESEEPASRAALLRLQGLINSAKTLEAKAERTPKKNVSADELNVAKRAEERAKKATYNKEKTEEQQVSFRALPLPGNTPVKNNPLASTKAFDARIGSVDRLVRQDRVLVDDEDELASAMTSMKLFSCENEEEKEQARQRRAAKNLQKRHLLDEVNKVLLEEDGSTVDDDTSTVHGDIVGDRVEDPSTLAQQIAQLESKLKHEKTQRMAILNDIVDIDLTALVDRIITKDAGEDMTKRIVDHLRSKIYEDIHDFDSYSIDSSQDERVFLDTESPTLFTRQEEWVKRRDKKRLEARMQLEADRERAITGKPELSSAKKSWQMAKEAHEEALKRANDATSTKVVNKEKEKDKVREVKVIDWQKAKESHDQALKKAMEQEEMKRKAREEKKNANKVEETPEQLARSEASCAVTESVKTMKKKEERLQQPSSQNHRESLRKSSVQLIEQTRARSKLEQQEAIFLRGSKKSEAKNLLLDNDVSGGRFRRMESNINAFAGRSYAEMSEKEFRKLVKKITS
jgi:hypothetical protein